ncbi:MAG: hypothetical protein SOV27_03665, partial [Eubacteriales bacterium]|nr:hypothetical protein [Eubacteriales bacterium]
MKTTFRKLLKVVTPLLLVLFAMLSFAGVKPTNQTLTSSNVYAEEVADVNSGNDSSQDDASTDVDLGLEKWEDYADETIDDGPTTMANFDTNTSNDLWVNGNMLAKYTYVRIYNAEGLAYFAKQVNTGANVTLNGKTYSARALTVVLMADIDLSGKIWTPIGYDSKHSFYGKFFGNGHKITGLTIDKTVTADYKALFGCCGTSGVTTIISDLIVEKQMADNNFLVGYKCAGILNLYGCSGTACVSSTNPSYGIKNFYYQVKIKYPIYDNNGKHVNNDDGKTHKMGVYSKNIYSGALISNGKKEATFNFSDIYDNYGTYTDGNFKNIDTYANQRLNITKIEVQEYSYNNSSGSDGVKFYGTANGKDSNGRDGIVASFDNTQNKGFLVPYSKLKIVANPGSASVRSYPPATKSGQTVTMAFNYAHQSYIQIVLTLDYRFIAEDDSLFNLYELKTDFSTKQFGNNENAATLVDSNYFKDIYKYLPTSTRVLKHTENFTNISNRFEKSRTFAKGYADSDINARNYINNNQYDICMVVDTANTFPTDGGVRYYKYNSPIKYTFKNQNGILKLSLRNKEGGNNFKVEGDPSSTDTSSIADVIRKDSSNKGVELYIFNLYGLRVNNSKYNIQNDSANSQDSRYYSVNKNDSTSNINAHMIVHSKKYYASNPSLKPKMIYFGSEYQDMHMFGISIWSSGTDCDKIWDSSNGTSVIRNDPKYRFSSYSKVADYSSLTNGSVVYAKWYMMPTTYEYEYVGTIDNMASNLKFVAYKPYRQDLDNVDRYRTVSLTTVGNKKSIQLYYTEKLYIYDTDMMVDGEPSKFYYYLQGVDDYLPEIDNTKKMKENTIRQARDFLYGGKIKTVLMANDGKEKSLKCYYVDKNSIWPISTFYGAIEIGAVVNNAKYTVTKRYKEIANVYFRILNKDGTVLTQEVISSATNTYGLGLNTLTYQNTTKNKEGKDVIENNAIIPNSSFVGKDTFWFSSIDNSAVHFSGIIVNAQQRLTFTKAAQKASNMYEITI